MLARASVPSAAVSASKMPKATPDLLDEESPSEDAASTLLRHNRSVPTHFCRKCNETAVTLAFFSIFCVIVIVYNLLRPNVGKCDASRLAKHFYCYNATMPPGVHEDQH